MVLLQVPLRTDGLKMEPSGARVEGELIKREKAENILSEERDGMRISTFMYLCAFTECV